MLPRTLQRSLRRLAYQKDACNVCSCRCGTQFASRQLSTSTPFQYARRAPSTRSSHYYAESIPLSGLSPEDAKKYKEAVIEDQERASNMRQAKISQAHAEGTFGMTSDEVQEFMEAFREICNQSRIRVGAAAPASFLPLVEASGASEQDLTFLAMMMLRNKFDRDDVYWGRRLLYTLSAAGYIESTIHIMTQTLLHHREQPGTLRSAAVVVERGRLQKAAREGTSSRAMVLEGKIAYELGDHDTAIQMWWRAVEGATAKSKAMLAKHAAGEKTVDIASQDKADLSTPWNELIEAHFERSLLKGKNEWDLCEKAIQIGVEQDDPTAFYYAATYYKKRNEDGSHKATSEWLYYMTKAAASLVPKAMYELGVYYAESGWKYIEDEPPEHLKPTPFDTYPGKHVADTPWERVRQLFSFSDTKSQAEKDKDNIFHTAAWPSTPEQRYELAIRWLNAAAAFTYAPAHLFLAKLYMQETLWAGAQAPPEALELSPKRYYYASREDEADAHFTGDVKTHELPKGTEDPPNPDYDLELAKFHLLEVFIARRAVIARAEAVQHHRKTQRDIEFEDIELSRDDRTYPLVKYLDKAEVYDMWVKESSAMYNEAALICEDMGWSIYDHGGGLWYKAGLGGPEKLKAAGLRE
jgi:TPR repeat protein